MHECMHTHLVAVLDAMKAVACSISQNWLNLITNLSLLFVFSLLIYRSYVHALFFGVPWISAAAASGIHSVPGVHQAFVPVSFFFETKRHLSNTLKPVGVCGLERRLRGGL